MSELDIYDPVTGTLALRGIDMEVEFLIACHQAIENNECEFIFHGYTIEVGKAVDVLQAIASNRTYH